MSIIRTNKTFNKKSIAEWISNHSDVIQKQMGEFLMRPHVSNACNPTLSKIDFNFLSFVKRFSQIVVQN